jgi:hypothetical protein
MVTVSQNYTERIIMAKKTSSKNSKKFPKTKTPKLNKVVTSSKDDCDEGSCPIDKKKKKTIAAQSVPVVPQVSLCSRVMAALFFWK